MRKDLRVVGEQGKKTYPAARFSPGANPRMHLL